MLELDEELQKSQRAELERVLGSASFARAASLGQLLRYLCETTIDGRGGEIKEYDIAVEALGKSPDFDQKKDSIVRVEAHRLRKRLRQFYEQEGQDHAIQIVLPPGCYVPQFVKRDEGVESEPVDSSVEIPVVLPPQSLQLLEVSAAQRRSWWRPIAFALVLVFLVVATGVALSLRNRQSAPPAPAPDAVPAELDVLAVRIRAGASSDSVDLRGQRWMSDRYFTGGDVHSTLNRVEGTDNPLLYQTSRFGHFSYDIPLKPGYYELSLHFSETEFGAGTPRGADVTRTFHVMANGHEVLHDFDIITDAGDVHTADIRVFKNVTPASDGRLHLEFLPGSNPAMVNAIAIVPGSRGRFRPIRMVSRREPYTDINGQIWTEDRFAFGGKHVRRVEGIEGTDDPDLYRGERYGRLTYVIPVPTDSTYTVIFHFAETWWGKKGGGGVGSRIFDLFCNGEALLREFDVFKEAGGDHKALRKVFRGLRPSPQGKLVFTAIPSRNYAFVNAVEVLDEATGSGE